MFTKSESDLKLSMDYNYKSDLNGSSSSLTRLENVSPTASETESPVNSRIAVRPQHAEPLQKIHKLKSIAARVAWQDGRLEAGLSLLAAGQSNVFSKEEIENNIAEIMARLDPDVKDKLGGDQNAKEAIEHLGDKIDELLAKTGSPPSAIESQEISDILDAMENLGLLQGAENKDVFDTLLPFFDPQKRSGVKIETSRTYDPKNLKVDEQPTSNSEYEQVEADFKKQKETNHFVIDLDMSNKTSIVQALEAFENQTLPDAKVQYDRILCKGPAVQRKTIINEAPAVLYFRLKGISGYKTNQLKIPQKIFIKGSTYVLQGVSVQRPQRDPSKNLLRKIVPKSDTGRYITLTRMDDGIHGLNLPREENGRWNYRKVGHAGTVARNVAMQKLNKSKRHQFEFLPLDEPLRPPPEKPERDLNHLDALYQDMKTIEAELGVDEAEKWNQSETANAWNEFTDALSEPTTTVKEAIDRLSVLINKYESYVNSRGDMAPGPEKQHARTAQSLDNVFNKLRRHNDQNDHWYVASPLLPQENENSEDNRRLQEPPEQLRDIHTVLKPYDADLAPGTISAWNDLIESYETDELQQSDDSDEPQQSDDSDEPQQSDDSDELQQPEKQNRLDSFDQAIQKEKSLFSMSEPSLDGLMAPKIIMSLAGQVIRTKIEELYTELTT